jgi:DNA polymerase-3 subunit alpha
LGAAALDQIRIDELKRILMDHPGPSPVMLALGQGKVLRLADDFNVDVDRVAGELRVAFGHDAVML